MIIKLVQSSLMRFFWITLFIFTFTFSLAFDAEARGNKNYYKANALIYSTVNTDNIRNGNADTFYSDADGDAIGLLFIRGELKDGYRQEAEIIYSETPTEFSLNSATKVNIKTIHLMQNYLLDFGVTETTNLVFGIGAGAAFHIVNTETSTGDDDNENATLGFNLSAGIDINEKVEFLARYTNYGEVEGGSRTSGGAPKFDYETHSLILKYKF